VNRGAAIGAAAVAAHALVSGLHGWAHQRLGVSLNAFQLSFVVVVIGLAPLAAAALLFTRQRAAGAWTLLVSMAASLLFGAHYHFVAVSPDHVSYLPAGDDQGFFRWTAAALLPVDAAGAAVGAWLLRGRA
jgi:hypothetical protein